MAVELMEKLQRTGLLDHGRTGNELLVRQKRRDGVAGRRAGTTHLAAVGEAEQAGNRHHPAGTTSRAAAEQIADAAEHAVEQFSKQVRAHAEGVAQHLHQRPAAGGGGAGDGAAHGLRALGRGGSDG
ncbi:hypothetical protein D9M71_598150 [compost metagenome]